MVIPLVTPIGSNFLKDWPEQNAINCDLLDNFAGPNCLRTHSSGQYLPIFTASNTNPTLGGTNEIKGYYYRIWNMVYTWGYFRFGTGFNVGNGDYIISLPFKVDTNLGISFNLGRTPILGNGFAWDESAAGSRQPLTVHMRTDQSIQFGFRGNSGASSYAASNTLPLTWAIDDGIYWAAQYIRSTT